MLLGILCTMINDFGRKGFYNSQETGLARCLCNMGHRVIVYKGVDDEEETVHLENNKLTVHYIKMPHVGANGYFFTNLLNPNLKGLFCFSDQQLFLPHVYSYCKKHGITFVPYVGTAHSLYSGTLKGSLTNQLFSLGTLGVYKKIPVIVKTPAAKKELEQLGVHHTKIAPVGLDMTAMHQDFRKADIASLRKKYGFSKDSVLLCNISRMQPEKRVLELIDLFDRIKDKKDFEMLLVGEGDLELEVERRIAKVSNRVRHIKKIPYDQIWEVYAMSDYFVNMNKGEIFGMACMEAVYYETSVAAIRAIGPGITLKGMEGHCLCDSDKDIEDWLCAPYPSRKLLSKSAKEAETRYSWQNCADAFLQTVKE